MEMETSWNLHLFFFGVYTRFLGKQHMPPCFFLHSQPTKRSLRGLNGENFKFQGGATASDCRASWSWDDLGGGLVKVYPSQRNYTRG